MLIDLPKVFDTINHKLLIAKLHAYGFEKSTLKLLLITFQIDGNAQK